MRFLTGKAELSAAEVRYFTEVDHHDHEALVALHHLDGSGLGTARYLRCAEDPEAAEIVVTQDRALSLAAKCGASAVPRPQRELMGQTPRE